MKIISHCEQGVHIELSRRNLLALLHKLEKPFSAKLISITGEDGFELWVGAAPDAAHYADREPGRMSQDTEEFIRERG